MDKQKRRAEPAVAIFRLILAGMVIVNIILDLGLEKQMIYMPEKYIYCPGPVRYLAGNPDARERCIPMSSRIAPYSAVYHLTSPCSSSFYVEKEKQEKIISAHLAFNNLLQHNRPRVWGEIRRQIRALPADRMEFSAYWPNREDFAFYPAKTRAAIVVCSLDLLSARFRSYPELREKIEDISRELEQLEAFRIFRKGEYCQKALKLKNKIFAWIWIRI